MAGCRIVNANVEVAVDAIKTSSSSYLTAGETLVDGLNAAIAEMEGETKDALKKFIDTDVKEFVMTSLPEALTGMADLLEANRTNFVNVDTQIAGNISGG